MVIEDDTVLVTVIEELLRFEGLNVLVAQDAATGFQLATEAHPDLILCDINLPHINGYAVFRMLQEDSRANTIPFVFMTGDPNFDEILQKTSLGREKIISKPFDALQFLAVIHQWV